MLFNEPKLLKFEDVRRRYAAYLEVSVLFNEPKLLKFHSHREMSFPLWSFSALQRAEIAEILQPRWWCASGTRSFSALQRAEIAEIFYSTTLRAVCQGFSALQRAEIAEI